MPNRRPDPTTAPEPLPPGVYRANYLINGHPAYFAVDMKRNKVAEMAVLPHVSEEEVRTHLAEILHAAGVFRPPEPLALVTPASSRTPTSPVRAWQRPPRPTLPD